MRVVVHDGTGKVTVDGIDPEVDEFRGFVYTLLVDETMSNSVWYINGEAVTDGEVVDGLTFVTEQIVVTGQKLEALARLSFDTPGVIGDEYELTHALETNRWPKDNRTMVFTVVDQ